MKEQDVSSFPGLEVPSKEAAASEIPASDCAESLAAACESGGFVYGDFSELDNADPVPPAAEFRLLTEGYKIGWALTKEIRLLREQVYLHNSLLFGISEQVWGCKLSLIRPLKYEKPRRRAAAKAADKPKAAKAAKAPKTKRTKEGKNNE